MSNNYYTPEIEEFHVGFEYEILQENDKWEKESILHKPEIVTLPYMKIELIRVKHLDLEDIESLGFKKHKSIPDYFRYEDFVLRIERERKISIYIYDEYTVDKLIFIGLIKNKSELKKLIVQLGIKT